MSEPINDTNQNRPLLQEENLPTGTITWVGIGSLALFAAGIYAAYLLLTNQTLQAQALGKSEIPAALQKHDPEMGIVDQQLFELEHRAQDEKQSVSSRLTSYGWVDKSKGVVHIPVSEAMKQVLSAQPGQQK